MKLQEVKALVKDINDELSNAEWSVLVEVFTMLEKVYEGRSTDELTTAQNAATATVFGDLDVEDWLDIFEGDARSKWDVKGTLVGAVLATSKMSGESLEATAAENELVDYLMVETVLGDLTDDQWSEVG